MNIKTAISTTSLMIITAYLPANATNAANQKTFHGHRFPPGCAKDPTHSHVNGHKYHRHHITCGQPKPTKPKPQVTSRSTTSNSNTTNKKPVAGPVWSAQNITKGYSKKKVVTSPSNTPERQPVQRQVVRHQPVRHVSRPRPTSQPTQPVSWSHRHPAIPNCTRAVQHSHQYQQRAHKHRYSCQKKPVKVNRVQAPVRVNRVQTPVRVNRVQAPVRVNRVQAPVRVNRVQAQVRRPQVRPQQPAKPAVKTPSSWVHQHPAIPNCTRAVQHNHQYQQRAHKHRYSCQKRSIGASAQERIQARRAVGQQPRVVNGRINMRVIREEVRATGIYRGSINGVVTPQTRSSLESYKKKP